MSAKVLFLTTALLFMHYRCYFKYLAHTVSFNSLYQPHEGFPGGSVVKNLPTMQEMQENLGSVLRRFSGGEHGNPLQYSCLDNPTDRGACQVSVHRGHKELDMTD